MPSCPNVIFFKSEVEFLGHFVNASGIRMDERKVQTVRDWPVPRTVSDLRSFLGLAGYYRKFVAGFARIAAPLTDLLRKDVSFAWSPEAQSAFDALKSALTTAPVLALFDPNAPAEIVVHTDASDFAIGAVLSQGGRPIAFESRKLTSAEQGYATHDREMLAIVHALRAWRPYLHGRKPLVYTDHSSLRHFLEQPQLNDRQTRWFDQLAEFVPDIKTPRARTM